MNAQSNPQPFGFENNSVGGWVGNGSTETAAINSTAANARTGSYSLKLTTTSTGGNKAWYSNTPYDTSASGVYIHFIYWALAQDPGYDVDASMRYSSSAPPSGAGSTANASTAVTLSTTAWTRVSYNVNSSSTRYYFPAPRKITGGATSVYMDDGILYKSNSSTTDLTDPGAPTALTATAAGSNVNLSWTSNTDAGTGVQATIILRTSVTAAVTPDLNDQAVYSTTGGASGPNIVGDWTIISTTTGAAATTYTDNSVPNGVYKYAVILRDLAYNHSLAAVSPSVTVGAATPTITLNTTGFTGVFGNVVTGTNSAEQTYTVSGSNLTGNITVTAPAGFQVSLTTGSGFASSVSLTPAGGNVAATAIYVRYSPTAATGATGSLTITNATTGATTGNVTVSGNALAVEPTTAGTITFGTITNNSIVVNLPTVGNGTKRIIVARAGSAVSYTPTDAASSTGVNANFTTATDQGSGNKIIYDGNGSGSAVVTMTGLTAATTYYFTVYEYNEGTGTSQNYLLTPAATSSAATISPLITVNQTGFTGIFGNVVTGTNSATQQYTVSGAGLNTDITVTAPAGFQVSTSATTGFGTTLTLTQTGGTVASTIIYVRFSPTAATGATGSLTITHTSTGATTQNVTVSGNALAIEPTTAGTISFGAGNDTSVVINLPTVGNGSKRIIVAHAGSSVSFIPADGTIPAGINASFSVATDQGGGNKVVYNGTGSGPGVVSVIGMTPGTQYYFTVYEYNEGTGASQNYLTAPVAAGSVTTTVTTPVITVNQTGFTGTFGNVVTGTNSATQQYTVSGTGLSAGIVITAPAGFQVSTSAITGFGTTLTLTPVGTTVASTIIYVRYSPTAAAGATGNLTITHTSTGATTQNVTVSGNALATEPTTAGTITFGMVTGNSAVINLPTVGNGAKRIIVAHAGSAVTFSPIDAISSTGVNSNFSLASDQGSSNKIVYDGTGSGAGVVTVTGLAPGTQYYFTVYEYNEGTGASQNYLLTPAATANTTTATPAITLNTTGFTGAFGNVVTGTNSAEQTYTVSGSNLTGNITVTAPAGFQVSLTTGSGFASSVNIAPVGATVAATTIYVRYAPTAATGATGSLTITNATAGATTQNATVSGNALAAEPMTAGTITFGPITGNSIVVNLPTVGNGSRRIIVAHALSAVTFTPTDAVAVTGVNANFTTATDQGSGNKVVYDGTGSGTGVVTVTGLTSGTAYYFTVYEYNMGTGTSQNYLISPAATSSTSTTTPVITVVQTGFTGVFGNVVTGTNSATQQYTVSGSGLSAGITVTAPAGFQVSTSATTGFSSTITVAQTGGTVASTIIYVRYSPTAATGATGSLTITNASTGAPSQSVTVSGNALATEPTTAGAITFGTITNTSIVVNLPTAGNGGKRIILARAGSAVSYTPTDAVSSTGVNANFTTATDQGSGNRIIYDGAGSGAGLVTLTGLTPGTQYYFTVYEYNEGTGTSQNYELSPAATGNATTTAPVPTITINQSSFNGTFGNVAMNSFSAPHSYIISGTDLVSSITVTAPAGFQVSLSAASGYGTTLSLTPAGGTVPATTVYVRFAPTTATGATGTLLITNAATNAVTQNVVVNGNALAIEPTAIGTLTFGLVTQNSVVVNLPTVGNGTRRIILINLGSPSTFVPTDGIAVSGVNANYALAANQGGGNRIVYDGTGSGAAVVTVTGLTSGMLYYFTVYEYNVGTGSSYNYLLTPAAGSNITTVIPGLGIPGSMAAADVQIYPNPVQDVVTIKAPAPVHAILTDASGKVVYRMEERGSFSLGALPAGIYTLIVTDSKGGIVKKEQLFKVN